MKKMKDSNPNTSTHHNVSAGEYGPDVLSPQAVEFMKGSDLSWQQKSLNAEYARKDIMEMFCGPERKTSEQETKQGGYNYEMGDRDNS